MRATYRSGYTGIELVVVVCVLFFLAALIVPALHDTRTISRRSVCQNNTHNLALAAVNYATAKGEYPGYLCPIPIVGGRAPEDNARVSWIVKILPYMERTDIYQLYRDPPRAAAMGTDPRQIYLSMLVCPSAFDAGLPKRSPPPCNYAANAGRQDTLARPRTQSVAGYPPDWRANGVFFNLYHDEVENPAGAPLESISQDYISEHDGSSMTVMLAERVDAGSYSVLPSSALDVEAALGCVWWPSATNEVPFEPPASSARINGPFDPIAIHRARPSSKHRYGFAIAFCDGHSRFISEDTDYGVWCLLQTPNGAQCNTPGKLVLEPAGRHNNYGFLRSTQVDESRIP